MNYGGNMPDWHQYNPSQPIGSEVPSVGQNVSHSPIFGPTISPRRLNGPTYSPEGLNKSQNETSYIPRNFQQSPNTLSGPNVPPENTPMGSSAQMQGPHAHYGTPSPRNSMIEGTNPSLDSRTVSGALSEAINQRSHQISMSRPAGQLNCPTINGSMGPMSQRNAPTNLQPSIPTSSRQGPGTYVACKGPCCNPDTNMSYQSWEKFGPYSPNVSYRDTGYPEVNRRFGNEFENREQLGTTGMYNVDPRRNFPNYKYRKDPIIQRPYAHPPSVIQNYPVQNYNFPADYQKYPAYPVKEYTRENPIANPQNPAMLKYQEQGVIVQQKYFTKPVQYQNGVIPKNIVPNSLGGNVISRTQNPYFNPQLARDFPRAYSESAPIPNRAIRTPNPIHASYPKYQMYQQKIAMERYTIENQLRDLTRIPGYQSHPKYQESMLRYRELLRLQQTVDYQSTVQDAPKALTPQGSEEMPPINLQFDQNGVLINTNFQPAGYSPNLQSPINVQNSKNVHSVSSAEVRPLNLQQPDRFKVQAAFDDRRQDHVQNQVLTSLPQTEPSRETEQRYSIENHQSQAQKYESETLNLSNSADSKTSCVDKRNSKDFADKPELDVRQFLANWDESEDEDGANANLPDVVLSNSTSCAVHDQEDPTAVLDSTEEATNCSESEDCRSRDDCGVFESNQNETKPHNSLDNQIYRSDLPPSVESTNSRELDLSISNSEEQHVRTGTVIQSTSTESMNETPLHKLENFANGQATNLSYRAAKSINNNESQEPPVTVETDIIVKEESPVEEETITSIKEHIKAYEHEAKTEIRSSIEDIIENGENSRSCCGKESSEDTKHEFGSDDDLSESSDSDSMSSDSLSSFIKSPKTIHGTEIHVDAQELSANPGSPKSNSEMVESPNLQKQSSFASEESHNPDDISLPDLPTSECTPISTTLNTPIHSDSEESSDPVIDLTTPANPIEIIQNSPMLSFTHSPIKMEPYEHLDDNDSTDKTSHFEFQTSNSCDNDYGRLTDVSSHTTEQFNTAQNDEDTFDSDCVEIVSEKAEQQRNNREMKMKNDVMDDITEGKSLVLNNGNVIATDMTNNALGKADRIPWPSVSTREHDIDLSNNTEDEGVKNGTEKSENPSDMDNRLSVRSEATKDHSNDHMLHVSGVKNYHSTSRWLAKCESSENLTALNLVKDENKIRHGSENLQVVPEESRYQSNSSSDEECNPKINNQAEFPSTEHTVEYASSSEEDKIYPESEGVRSNFPGSSNIPLIPGEDFEEPTMPVLPMEGNCLTKILKNTSPITDLDVLGSDDEKLEKMDEIWMEVGGVDTVSKITGASTDAHTECGEAFNREKSSRIKLRTSHKNEWKRVKNLAEVKDISESFGRGWSEGEENGLKGDKNWQEYKFSVSEKARKEAKPIDGGYQSAIISETDNVATILQDKHSFSNATIFSKATSNSSCREDSILNNDIGSDTNATEIMKCKEKANHINDIATKLLENARLCEPELKRVDVEKKESSPSENSRESSKKRIQLLKEFRKVKNKVKVDKPESVTEKSEDSGENHAVAAVEIIEQCKRTNVEITDEKEIDNILKAPDTSIECRSPREINVNKEERTSAFVSADVMMSEDKFQQILNKDEETIKIKNTARENYNYMDIEGSITAENNSCVNSHQILYTKAVIPIIRNDINECAINLSKSSNDFDLLNTLGSKGCVINDSHESYVSEDDVTREPAETEIEINEEAIRAETKNPAASPQCFSGTEDNVSHSEVEEADNKLPQTKHVQVQNITESNRESNSSPTSTNFVEDILEDNDKQGTDEESSGNADHEKSGKPSPSLKRVEDSPGYSENPDNYVFETNEAKINACVSDQSQHPKSNDSPTVDVDDEDDEKPAEETIDSEELCDSENVGNDVVDESAEKEEEPMKLTDSFDDDERKSFLNPVPNEEISIEGLENSLQSESNVESMENGSKPTSDPGTEKSTGSSLLVEVESKIITDCSINIAKTSQDLDVTLDIHDEAITVHKDSESIEMSSILNEFSMEPQLGEFTEKESLNITLEPVSGTDGSASKADGSMAAFGLEDSFNCDFNNFDVAPNISNDTNTEESNSWKYSKAYARFEDCERYKNPDNFVNPILTSLERLDNLNTVPVYTTKDGKITYSPNPKFTYRALIMEAREREGYPSMRESYYGNPRPQESAHFSKNQASFRKRKNSEGHSYSSGSYSKKNYEPREHGESSTKRSPESWSRNSFSRDKYSRQSRDRSSHQFTPHNDDAEKKYSAEKIIPEKVSCKYKHRKGHAVFDEHDKKKNGTSDHFKYKNRTQFRQSREQSTPDSIRSRSERDLKGDQKISAIALPRSETSKTNEAKKIKNSRSSSSTEKHLNNGNQVEESNETEKLTLVFDENKHTSQSISNIPLPKVERSRCSNEHLVGRKFSDSEVEEIKSSSPKTNNQPTIDQNLIESSNNESNRVFSAVKSGLFSSEWEHSCENLIVQQENLLELKELAKPLLEEIEEIKLCDEIDDIRECRTSKLPLMDTTDIQEMPPLNSVEARILNERLGDTNCCQEKFKIEKDESILSNAVNKDAMLIPVEQIDDQKILKKPKIPNENEQAASLIEEIRSIQEEKSKETLPFTDNQIREDLGKDDVHIDRENEIESSVQIINEVEAETVASKLNDQVLPTPEELCGVEETARIERKEPKLKSHKIKTTNDSQSLKTTSEYENTSKPYSQFENYIAYSPSNESADDSRAIPKLVIKKTDSLNCKNVYLGPPTTASHDLFAERVLDKDEQGSKSTAHPKIPKILIRNAKSRPTTPSIEEIIEEKTFSVTTKEESKIPKVKIRLEDKRSRSPSVSSNENNSKTDATESKVPKMKIKLEDRLPKVFIENVTKESCRSNEAVQKTIPKMKIKKCKGALRHIADTQILPVSIPRMFIYTEIENEKETSLQTLTKKDINTTDKNSKTVVPSPGQDEEKIPIDADVKKIPKLKIKRQSSGCSIESNRKRHSMSPVQSELKKVRKSLKANESNDKKQSSNTSLGSEYQENLKKVDTFSVEQSYELAKCAVADQQQTSESIKDEETTSKRESTSGTPQEIPKVIIKRASSSAEFKCELSKGRRDAIIKNKRWQPEVKLQRSWVLDCMAKDLNLEKLTLKLATPGSMLKKCFMEKKPELGRSNAQNGSISTNSNQTKLFRSKSASDLVPTQGSVAILAMNNVGKWEGRNASDVARGLATRKRCKSDLGSRFLTYSENVEAVKKPRNDNHSTLDCENELVNCSNILLAEDGDKYKTIRDSKTNSEDLNASGSFSEGASFMETSERSPYKTLDENMNSKKEISVPKINLDASDRPIFNSDLNKRMLSGSTSRKNSSKSGCECFETCKEFTSIFMSDSEHRNMFEGSEDLAITQNGNAETVVGQKNTEEIWRKQSCTSDKSAEDNGKSGIKNTSTDYTEEEKTAELAAILMGSHNQAESVILNTGESVILQTAISMKPDILNNKPEIFCPDAVEAVENLETFICRSNTHKLDVDDNSDASMKEPKSNNAARDNLESHINTVEQENTSTLNGNVLITPVIGNSKLEHSEADELQMPNIGTNSTVRLEYSKESQSIIEMLSDSPSREVEIHSEPTLIEENGICLYHEDAIPTQFELELDVMDNAESDLEVPIPQDYPVEECLSYSGKEINGDGNRFSRLLNSEASNVILRDSKSETSLPEENVALKHLGEQDTLSSKETEKWNATSSSYMKTTGRPNTSVKKSSNCSDLLVKEVLAAKETLRKCLARSKNGSRFKPRARPKTAAEKKQGSSFDLSRLSVASQESFNKLESDLSININAEANCSRETDEGLGRAANSIEKLCQNQTETEYKVNKIKSDRKHSKGGKSNLIKKIYSSLPKNVHKLMNLTQIEECLSPKNNLIDAKDSVECMKGGETSISIKNSTIFIKNNSYSDARKKIPELINSKDSKYRANSKSSRHDGNSKYVGKSNSRIQNNDPRESSLNVGQLQEKPVSDAAIHKYKSLKTSPDQRMNLTTDKTKFKFYKIPKIARPSHSQGERLIEELQELHIKEARMPILEPQVDLNGGIQVSELSSDRDTSRSPPLITNQETRTGYETMTQTQKHRISFTEEKEDLTLLQEDVPEATPYNAKETTVADIVNNMAYHEKATIRHRRYCTLCERWFPTVARHRRHLSGYQHRHTELSQRRTIHALFTLFTGRPCPRLQPPGVVRIDCEPGELTPLQIAVQGVTEKPSELDDGNIAKPSREDK